MGLVSARTWAALVPTAILIGTFAFACSSFSSAATPDDAGSDAVSTGNDAPASSLVDDGCTLLVYDTFDDVDASSARWRLLGEAKLIDGEVELVPDQGSVAGALWLNVDDAPAGRLHATFTSKISPAGGDDGLAFAWAANQDAQLGGQAGNYGVCGGAAEGLAFVMAGAGDRVRLLNVSNDCKGDGGLAANVFGTNAVEVSASATEVTALIGDQSFTFTSPRVVRVRSLGFGAATGGGHARHAIDNVRVEICP